MLKWAWIRGLSLLLECVSLLIAGAVIIILDTSDGTGNFSSSMTLYHSISLFLLYFVPSGIDTMYGLGVFIPGMDITLAG